MDYVAKIKTNDIAKTVKIADLEHNSNLTRLNHITDKDLDRIIKYQKALKLLNDLLGLVNSESRRLSLSAAVKNLG